MVKPHPTRISAIVPIIVLMLAFAVAALALDRGGDVFLFGLGLVLLATSMELLRRANPPAG